MKEITKKEQSDFAEIGSLVQDYINNSLSGDALTASADVIKYKIDDVIQQRYGAEDLDKAKLNMAKKLAWRELTESETVHNLPGRASRSTTVTSSFRPTGLNDEVTVSNYFNSAGYRYFNFAFDDKILTLADIEAMNMTVNGTTANDSLNGWYASDTITGGAGNDTLSGNEGHDILDGGTGNDRLYGGKGSDIYLFAKGHNQDDVTDSMQNAGDIDSIQFTDASVQDLWFSRSNSHLLISEIGSNDFVTLDNWFSGSAWQNKVISVADGQSLEATQLQQLVDAMAVFAAGQNVTAMQPDQMRASMQMINSSDYWSHS